MAESDSTKTCNRCKQIWPATPAYFHRKSRNRDGLEYTGRCCLTKGRLPSHFRKKNPIEYKVWLEMKGRCYNHRNKKYKDYGERGIRICANWLHSFDAFFIDMGPRTLPRHSIDRINNNIGYFCGKIECLECGIMHHKPNCRWATRIEQANNRRSNRTITLNGKTATAAEWARRTGISASKIRDRLDKGWSAQEVLSTARYGGRPIPRNHIILCEGRVLDIRLEYSTGKTTQRELAKRYGVTQRTITCIVNRITWQHV